MFQGHQSDGNIHGNVMGISFHRNILLGYDGIHVVIILWVVVYQRVYIYIMLYPHHQQLRKLPNRTHQNAIAAQGTIGA